MTDYDDKITSPKLEGLKLRLETFQKNLGAVQTIGNRKLKPLEEKLEKARKELSDETRPLEARISLVEKEIWEERESLQKKESLSALKTKTVRTEDDFKNWYRAFIRTNKKFTGEPDAPSYWAEKVTGINVLKNELVAVRTSSDDCQKVFILDSLRLVGFHFTEKSKHPGDTSYRYAWLDVKDLTEENELKWEKLGLTKESYNTNSPITQKVFIGLVEKRRGTGLDSISFSKENIDKYLDKT